MKGSGCLLVDQRVAREVGDLMVAAKGHFTQDACARICVEKPVQQIFLLHSRRFHHSAGTKLQPDSGDIRPAEHSREIEAQSTLGRLLNGPSEYFAIRQIVVTIAVEPGAASDSK